MLARTALASEGAGNYTSNWEVHVYDKRSKTDQLVGAGAYPQWLPDGSGLVVLHPQGLYYYDLEDGTGELLYPSDGGETTISSKIDVSPHGRYVAWAAPQSGGVLVLKVNSWNPVEVETHRLIKTLGTWPVFSPDEQFLAMLEARQDESGSITSTDTLALVVYNIETLESARMLDLTQYDPRFSMVNDWTP